MLVMVPLALIEDNPFQTRSRYDATAIEELAESIRGLREARPETCGLIHVPPARAVDVLEGKVVGPRLALDRGAEGIVTYQVAAGHSRLRAFRLLAEQGEGWGEMPLDVCKLDDQSMADVAWAENQKRKDLSAVEEARALQAAMARFDWTQAQVGARWGLSRPAVGNKLRLLSLPESVQEKVVRGDVGERAVRALLPAMVAPAVFAIGVGLVEAGRSTDDIEREMECRLRQAGRNLSARGLWSAEWPGPRQGLGVPACKGCELRLKIGGEWWCLRPDCLATKEKMWNEEQVTKGIAAMQGQVGRPLVAYKAHNYSLLEFEYAHEQEVFEATCKTGCLHGRLGLLALVPSHTRGHGIQAEGAQAWFVCDKRSCFEKLRYAGVSGVDREGQRKAREREQRALAKRCLGVMLDEMAGVDLGGLAECAELGAWVQHRMMAGIPDSGVKKWLAKELDDRGAGFWARVAASWVAAELSWFYGDTKVEQIVRTRVGQLWAALGRDVSGETEELEFGARARARATEGTEDTEGGSDV